VDSQQVAVWVREPLQQYTEMKNLVDSLEKVYDDAALNVRFFYEGRDTWQEMEVWFNGQTPNVMVLTSADHLETDRVNPQFKGAFLFGIDASTALEFASLLLQAHYQLWAWMRQDVNDAFNRQELLWRLQNDKRVFAFTREAVAEWQKQKTFQKAA